MFSVRFTPDAKALVAELFARGDFTKPGLMVHRQGPRGNVTRTDAGGVNWSVERPHPWRAQVGDFQTFGDDPEDVFLFDEIPVWLALVPRPGESGVEVSVRDGELFVDEIRA